MEFVRRIGEKLDEDDEKRVFRRLRVVQNPKGESTQMSYNDFAMFIINSKSRSRMMLMSHQN